MTTKIIFCANSASLRPVTSDTTIDSANKLYNQAQIAAQNGDYREALNLYQQYRTKICTSGVKPHIGLLTRIFEVQNRLAESKENFAELKPEDAGKIYDENLSQQGDLQDSLSGLEESLATAEETEKVPILLDINNHQKQLLDLEEQRQAILAARADLRKLFSQYGDWPISYQHAQSFAANEAQQAKPVSTNHEIISQDPKDAVWNQKPGWSGEQRGKLRILNGSEFIAVFNPDCSVNLDIPERISEPGIVVLGVGASWCSPCPILKAGMAELAQEFPEIGFAYLNIYSDDEAGLKDMQKVRGHQEMLPIDLLLGHGRDEKGYSRVGTTVMPILRFYDEGHRIAEYRGPFFKTGSDGRLIDKHGDPIYDENFKPILDRNGKPKLPVFDKELVRSFLFKISHQIKKNNTH